MPFQRHSKLICHKSVVTFYYELLDLNNEFIRSSLQMIKTNIIARIRPTSRTDILIKKKKNFQTYFREVAIPSRPLDYSIALIV